MIKYKIIYQISSDIGEQSYIVCGNNVEDIRLKNKQIMAEKFIIPTLCDYIRSEEVK